MFELQTKDNVKFYKTPDAILKKQLENLRRGGQERRSAENPLFKEILQSQLAFAKRNHAVGKQDRWVSRKNGVSTHYWGANGGGEKTSDPVLT